MIDRAVIQELKDQLVVICLGPHHRLYFLIRLNWFSKMMFYKKSVVQVKRRSALLSKQQRQNYLNLDPKPALIYVKYCHLI